MGYIILVLALLASMRAGMRLFEQRALLKEFGVSTPVGAAVMLYPLGIAKALFLPALFGAGAAYLAGFALLIPGLVFSMQAKRKLQCSGTDRTKPAEDAAELAFVSGLGCVLLFLLSLFMGAGLDYSAESVFR